GLGKRGWRTWPRSWAGGRRGTRNSSGSLDLNARLAHHAAVAGVLRSDVRLERLRPQVARLHSMIVEEALHRLERKDAPHLSSEALHDRLGCTGPGDESEPRRRVQGGAEL